MFKNSKELIASLKYTAKDLEQMRLTKEQLEARVLKAYSNRPRNVTRHKVDIDGRNVTTSVQDTVWDFIVPEGHVIDAAWVERIVGEKVVAGTKDRKPRK